MFGVLCGLFYTYRRTSKWEERKSMKQNLSSEKHRNVGEEVITSEIKKGVKKSAWTIIGGKKVWTRKCKHCGNIVIHRSISTFYTSAKHNKKCEKCRQIGKNNSFYGKTFSKKQLKEWSKKRTGEGNPMYGTLGGMHGKKHTEESIKRQSDIRKKYWKRVGHKFVPAFKKYRNEVTRLTERQPIHTLLNHEKRGVAGVEGAFHLDHIKSVWYGYTNNIEPSQIADISNLKFIPWLENQKKWYK